MATLSTGALTLLDWAKTLDPDGKVARIINILAQRNEILLDIPFMESNLPTGHRTTILSGLPAVAWRLFNAGVQPSKPTTVQVEEAIGMLETYSQTDVDLAKLGGNLSALRLSQAKPFLEAMTQEAARVAVYGNSGTAPEQFTGLAPRYSSLSAGNAQNIIDAGGTGTDNTSIWIVDWDEEACCGFFPKGSIVGLFHEDLGEQLIQNAGGVTGALMKAFVDHWQWKIGIGVKDWRKAVRICNIDVSNLVANSSAADLVAKLENALELFPNDLGVRRIYMNRTVRRMLRFQARTNVTTGGGLTFDNFDGKKIMMFSEVPVRTVDQILNTEARVT